MQPQCIQRKKFIHLQVIRPGKDTRRYTAALGPAIANRIRICSHEEAIVSSLNVVWQPSWPSNKHAAGEILLEIVPGSHNCGRGEKKKNPHLSATQPKHVHRKQSQGFFFQDWKTVREKNPSLLVVLLTGRSWIRGISTVEGHESEGEGHRR